MTVALALIALLWLLAAVAGVVSGRDRRWWLEGQGKTRALEVPEVDAVVPARNEEQRLPALLDSLLAQDHPPARILVIDDRSEDGTKGVIERYAARDPRVERIAGDGPPAGWTGKPAALQRGFQESKAPWVLFVDADVRLLPACLGACLARACGPGGPAGISLWGRWEVPSLWARLLQSVVGGFVRGTHPLDRVNDLSRPEAFLNGQYLLVRREALEGLGGWGAVRGEVLEDVALARLAKARGVRIELLLAPALMSVVPYHSLAEAWLGYRKNFVAGAGGVLRALAAAAVIFLGSVAPCLVLVLALAQGRAALALAASAACLAMVIFRVATARLFYHPRVDALFHPLANLLFVGLILDACARRVLGVGSTWKGRVVR